MKILVTGGAGYKGVKLTEYLLQNNYDVTILDNFMYGYNSILHLFRYNKFEILKLDIRNIQEKDIKNFDVIFHLAGISGMPACASNPHSAEMINVVSTKRLVEFLHKDQILINASTTSMYGDASHLCTEESLITPVSIYSKTKYEAEKIVHSRENSISLRFATVFGISSRMRDDLIINDFVYKAIYDKVLVIFGSSYKRVTIHIDDAINAYIFTFNNIDKMKNEVYNIGDESLNYSKLDVANKIKEYVKFEIIDSSLPDVDVRNFIMSFEKIKKIGYKTEKTLDDGIKELLKLYSFYVRYNPYNII